ncbi:hypothetical protein [Rhodopirellula bahusiensis]|uniref:hypothetical protein n=1 Tax=Rhodopirellula bahusiensis TaxID=2014065 RepID=UPI0032646211
MNAKSQDNERIQSRLGEVGFHVTEGMQRFMLHIHQYGSWQAASRIERIWKGLSDAGVPFEPTGDKAIWLRQDRGWYSRLPGDGFTKNTLQPEEMAALNAVKHLDMGPVSNWADFLLNSYEHEGYLVPHDSDLELDLEARQKIHDVAISDQSNPGQKRRAAVMLLLDHSEEGMHRTVSEVCETLGCNRNYVLRLRRNAIDGDPVAIVQGKGWAQKVQEQKSGPDAPSRG